MFGLHKILEDYLLSKELLVSKEGLYSLISVTKTPGFSASVICRYMTAANHLACQVPTARTEDSS